MLCAFVQQFVSFGITENLDVNPRFTFLADSLRGVEGDFDDVPVDHVLDDMQSGRPVHMSVIEYRVEIDVPLILAI